MLTSDITCCNHHAAMTSTLRAGSWSPMQPMHTCDMSCHITIYGYMCKIRWVRLEFLSHNLNHGLKVSGARNKCRQKLAVKQLTSYWKPVQFHKRDMKIYSDHEHNHNSSIDLERPVINNGILSPVLRARSSRPRLLFIDIINPYKPIIIHYLEVL